MTSSQAIETANLRKVYNGKVAVADLSLSVPCGEVFGFLGPNGAGKTTAIKMLLGLAAPTSGTGRLLGRPIGDPAARARAGFLPELLARVGLAEHGDKRLRGYSKGMLQRIGLAQALLNRPEIVFLDEPTSGLDPVGRILVRDIIRELREQGTTVFLNSHLLSEVEITCDRVIFIKHGAVVRSVSLGEIGQGALPVEIRIGALPAGAHAQADLLSGLSRWGRDARVEDGRLHVIVDDEAALPEIARWLIDLGIDLYGLIPQRMSLEDMFLQIVGTDGGL